MENAKVYVEVLVNFDKDGTMSPVEFIWEDGTKYLKISCGPCPCKGTLCKPKSRRNRDPLYGNGEWEREPLIL